MCRGFWYLGCIDIAYGVRTRERCYVRSPRLTHRALVQRRGDVREQCNGAFPKPLQSIPDTEAADSPAEFHVGRKAAVGAV